MKKKASMMVMLVLLVFTTGSAAAGADVYFSLEDNPEKQIINQIDRARDSIDIALYYFTDRQIARAVVRAHDRGIKVRVYLDKSQTSKKYSKSRYLVKHGIPVKISSNNDIMHNKFAVIDDRIVLTGSYNWTASAGESNDENLLVIEDRHIAEEYGNKFEEFWTTKVDSRLTEKLYAAAGQQQSGVGSDNGRDNDDTSNADSTGQLLKVTDFNYDADPSWDESFTIKNVSDRTVNLNGWRVKDEADHQFIINANAELGPGESVTVYNHSDTGISINYKQALWNNVGDTLFLFNQNEKLQLKYGY